MSTYAEKMDMNEQPRDPADTDEERAVFLKWWEGPKQGQWSGSPCAVAYAGWLAAKSENARGDAPEWIKCTSARGDRCRKFRCLAERKCLEPSQREGTENG